MKNNAIQKELFKEFEVPKKKKKMPYSILPKNYILFNVSYEQVIFITIAVIMLMVLLFSLGVERGKYLILSAIKREKELSPQTADIADVKKEIEDKKVEAIEPSGPEPIKGLVEGKRVSASKSFTIQVIAYRSKKLAQKELIRLSKKGFKPFIIAGGGYYQICAGEYRDHNEAKNNLLELRKIYKDSFIRKR